MASMGCEPWKILMQLTLVSSLSLAFARAEGPKVYICNQSNADLLIANTTAEGEAAQGDVIMGVFQPTREDWRQPLSRGGNPGRIQAGNTVFLTLASEPESPRVAAVTLTQEGRLVGTLRILVWMHGLASHAVAEVLQQDPQAEGTLYGEENLYIYFGFREPPRSNGHARGPLPR
jgi:hypothetical protein